MPVAAVRWLYLQASFFFPAVVAVARLLWRLALLLLLHGNSEEFCLSFVSSYHSQGRQSRQMKDIDDCKNQKKDEYTET